MEVFMRTTTRKRTTTTRRRDKEPPQTSYRVLSKDEAAEIIKPRRQAGEAFVATAGEYAEAAKSRAREIAPSKDWFDRKKRVYSMAWNSQGLDVDSIPVRVARSEAKQDITALGAICFIIYFIAWIFGFSD